MSNLSKTIYFFVATIFFVVFDMFFSNYIIDNLQNVPENDFIDIVFIQNTGAAFSILQNSKLFLIIFSIAALILMTIYIFTHIKKMSGMTFFWISLLASGVFCNLYERITLGYVRDFFKLNFINFPVFNISDIFINISVFAIVIIIIKQNYSKANETNN